MRILVIGASGMLGRRVVPLLLAEGHDVTAVGRSRERLARLLPADVALTTVDMFDPDALARAARGHAAIINVATHVPGTGLRAFLPGAWREMDRVRREGSTSVADAALAAGVSRLIQESFALVAPDRGAEWVDESVPQQPAAYNRSVLDAEGSAHRVTLRGGVGVALRFALLYGGEGDGFTRDVLRSVRRGWLPLFGREEGYVSMVTHDDAARAVVASLKAPAGIYNVVDDEPLTRRALAETLGRLLGVRTPRLPPRWMAALGGSVGETIARSVRLSNRALRFETGWQPRFPSGREGWRAARALVSY